MTEDELNINAKRLRKFGRTIFNFLRGHTKVKKNKHLTVAMVKYKKLEDSLYIAITDGTYFDIIASIDDMYPRIFDSFEYQGLINYAIKSIKEKKENPNYYIVQ